MRKVKNWKLLIAVILAVIGFASSWLITLYSDDVALVRSYLIANSATKRRTGT